MRIVRLVLPAVAGGAAAFRVVPLASAASAPLTAAFAQTSTVDASTAAQPGAALPGARPGQTIRLAPRTYDGPRTTILTNPAPSGSGPSGPVTP